MADCTTLQADLDALDAAIRALHRGERRVEVQYGDKKVTYQAGNIKAMTDEREYIHGQLRANGCAGYTASSRIAQPSMGSGRC